MKCIVCGSLEFEEVTPDDPNLSRCVKCNSIFRFVLVKMGNIQ